MGVSTTEEVRDGGVSTESKAPRAGLDRIIAEGYTLMVISDTAKAFSIQYSMLTLTGIWPKKNPSIVYRIRTLLSWISALGIYTIMLIELIHDIHSFTKLPETLYIMATYMGFIIKLLVFSYRKKELLNIIKFLKDPIFKSYPEDLDHHMAKSIKQSVLLASIYRVCVVGLVLCYVIYPILDHKPLPFPLPYDLGKYTLIMYTLQMIGESFSAVNNISLDLMYTCLMGIIAAQLDILSEKITRLEQNDTELTNLSILNELNETAIEKLKNCVKHHMAIISMVNSLERVFTIALFGQFVTSAIVICNTIFDFVL
ncbi:hypothetical protein ILUMI_02058, partial [Ignelater luminosus]